MLTLYRSGDGRLHRMPAGRKLVLVVALALGVSLLPSSWWAAGTAAGVTVLAYGLAQLGGGAGGMRGLARQVFALRWILAITLASQLIFLGPEPAIANSARVAAAIVVSALLVLTTRVTDLLDALERGLQPLERVRIDPQSAALLLTVTLTTIPVLARLAKDVREAQRARGAGAGLRTFAVPMIVLASKHAFDLGDALTGRGPR